MMMPMTTISAVFVPVLLLLLMDVLLLLPPTDSERTLCERRLSTVPPGLFYYQRVELDSAVKVKVPKICEKTKQKESEWTRERVVPSEKSPIGTDQNQQSIFSARNGVWRSGNSAEVPCWWKRQRYRVGRGRGEN